jgi:NitT/TauT family transport system substrate-binding protein
MHKQPTCSNIQLGTRVALGVLACTFAACNSKPDDTQTSRQAVTAAPVPVRIAIGTQDTTINCAAAGLVIREEKLLEQYLPKDGRYEVTWKNFTSGPPLTSEMVARKLDIGALGDFPSVLNAVAMEKSGKSVYVSALSGSTIGGGNALVVPIASPAQQLSDLKGKQISVPFGSAAHGMMLRAIADLGWDPERDVNLVSQSPEVGGTSLKTNKIDGHADFVPFGELFPFRGIARKIYDGSSVKKPTSHGVVVRSEFAAQHPELVVAFLRAMLEADRRMTAEPEKYSELIERVSGVSAEVDYMFHGPLGIQTRDFSIKPEYRKGLKLAVETLATLKRLEGGFDIDAWIDDRYIRQAAKESGLDYDARLADYRQAPLTTPDAVTGRPIEDAASAAQLWVRGEAKVRAYSDFAGALAALRALPAQSGVRVFFVHDRNTGMKLLASTAWYVKDGKQVSAFLLKNDARVWAKQHGGEVVDFATLKGGGV